MMSREKTFLAFGLPSDQSARDQVKQVMQKVGFRDVLIEDDVAYLTVPEYQKLSDVREKLSNSGQHKLIIMPEVAQTVTMVVDDEWRRVMLQHHITLDEFHHRVNVDASRDRITLSGCSNEVNRIVKYIEKSVCDALSKQNSCHNEHSDVDYDSSRNSPAKELSGEHKTLNGTRQKNEKVGNGFTDDSGDSIADDDRSSTNSKGSCLENGAKQRNKGRELSEMKRNEREERGKQSETNGTYVGGASAEITKAKREHKGRDEDDDLVVCPFNLNDHQLKFIKCFYPDIYAVLNRIGSGTSCRRKENVEYLQSVLKDLKINELETLSITFGDTDTVLLKALPPDITKPKNIWCEFNSMEVRAVGLQEDLKQWRTKVNEELSNIKKSSTQQKSVKLDDCQLKFIKTFYPEVYKYVNSFHLQKTSNDNIEVSGKPDDVNKLSNWLAEHNIHLVECQQIQTRLSVDEMKTMVNAKRNKWTVMIDMLHEGTYVATGSLQDIRLFQSEIKDRETAISRSSALLGMSATSKDSQLRFEFTTPRSSIDVIVAKGNLTKQDTDAIVSPSNPLLKPYGGAAKAIADAAGRQLVDECVSFIRIHGLLSTTEVTHTSGGRMYPPIRYVIHACGPMDKGNWKLEEELEKTFINCFKCAEKLRVKSLSIPAISSGTFQVKKDVVAKCTWNALMRFDEEILAKAVERVYLKEIRFINIDSEATGSMVKTFRKCWNEYRFTPTVKTSTESDQSQRRVRRSNSFSGLRSKLNDESNLNERSSLKTTEKSSPESSMTSPIDTASGVSVPKIKSYSSAHSASEAKCCVCMKQRPVSLLKMHSSCSHKCCPLCTNNKCCLCVETRKLNSGSRSTRSALHPTGPASSSSSSEVDGRKSLASSGYSMSRGRSASVSERGRGFLNEISDSYESHSSPVEPVQKKTQKEEYDSDCCICMDTIKDAKRLDCGHTFCRGCIERAFLHQPKCPSCGKIFGLLKGNQPDGTMTVRTKDSLELSGYRGYGTIVISYDIPDGIQSSVHPNPGKRYRGTHRLAYLPRNAEGEEICRLLKKAFDARLIFTVGKSNTTGHDNVVVWNDIHHKTAISGQYGYPDSTYLKRVREELAAKGIKSSSSSSSPAMTSDDDDDNKKTRHDLSLKTGTRTTDRYPSTSHLFSSNYCDSHLKATASGSSVGSGGSYKLQAESSPGHPSTVMPGSSGPGGGYQSWSSNRVPYKQ